MRQVSHLRRRLPCQSDKIALDAQRPGEMTALSVVGTTTQLDRGLFRARRLIKESNLLLVSNLPSAINAATRSVFFNRARLEEYLRRHRPFLWSLIPIEVEEDAPRVVRLAADAALVAGVGPFAAVPGAIADLALEEMLACGGSTSLVENGGEISAKSTRPLNVAIYSGNSPLSSCIGFRLEAGDFPIGIGTSSAVVSHALSFGEADAAVAVTDSAVLADASATAICNAVSGNDVEASVQAGLEAAEEISQIRGALVIRGRYVGSVGRLPRLLNLRGDLDDMWKATLQDLLPQEAIIL
jgi:ApbE superfamily uncharacterized protein (UPF0280 family)